MVGNKDSDYNDDTNQQHQQQQQQHQEEMTTTTATKTKKKHHHRHHQQQEEEQNLGTLWVGTAGFGKPSWCGPFHPRGTKTSTDAMLDALQQHFRTVEINGACHSMPTPSTIAKWKERCGKGFLMSPKMIKHVTHEHGGKLTTTTTGDESSSTSTATAPLKTLRTFVDTIAGLGEDHLGPILIQFPRTKQLSVEEIRCMSHVIKASDLPSDVKIAIELRNEQSVKHDPSLLAELERQQWCLVQHPNTLGRGTVVANQRGGGQQGDGLSSSRCHGLEPLDPSWPKTAKTWMYIRLHYNNDEHFGGYTSEELRQQAVSTIVGWLQQGIDVYAYMLNDDDKAAMPHNAKTLERMCYEEIGLSIPPKPPKQVQSITSFFAPIQKKKQEQQQEKTGSYLAS